MSAALAALEAALQDNVSLMETLLEQKEYDEALLCMDERLALIGSLVQLVRVEPMQRQLAVTLAASIAIEDARQQALAASHHQVIFKQLAQVGKANKAGQAYRVNSKEF
ncbi:MULTISPECIES: hypothetical protein [Aeromonas]|uniref:hypothetical protein n=1 Tax=Aeromonas TaxID=642 RepID=UPI000B00B992|nr:hypothetical protein [Aeromonas caviae]